ncbi:hypothetical protein K457DRAFT_18906 [Linnemannia elongata AG-77]|uniref:Uncharacterized protein n=1 Tax=Linnemannia elongata AG-77 TaxID=1314771 RepID=A0A197JWW7_9FUNG|nr:hypothetical protein K457DRAFT_18906 [Linnemannia elongata AG-77]
MSKQLRTQQPSHQALMEAFGREDAGELDRVFTYNNNNKTFLASLGTVSVVQYRPLSDDWCLYLPERDPGNGFTTGHSPPICNTVVSSKALYAVALPFVVAFADEMDLEEKSGKEKRAEDTTFVTGLMRVRDRIAAAGAVFVGERWTEERRIQTNEILDTNLPSFANPKRPQLQSVQHMIYPHDVFNNATTYQRQRIYLWIQNPRAVAESVTISSTKQGRAPTAKVSKTLQSKETIRKVRIVGVLETLFETGRALQSGDIRAREEASGTWT